jgi:glycosyltransferase involved in cell wall biosynthesis
MAFENGIDVEKTLGKVRPETKQILSQYSTITQEKPIWIEVVTDTYVPDINGVALSLGRLCSGLRERGHRVEIIRSGRVNGDHETAVLSWPLPGYTEIKVGAPWPGELRRRWQKNRPDIVYVAIESPLGYSAAAAALRLGIPLVGGFHTNFCEYLQKYGANWIGKQVWRYQKWFHARLNRTLVPSPDARDKLVLAGFTKVGILGRGVDVDLFNPTKRSEKVRRGLGAVGDAPIVLLVGRVSTEKNIGLALRAFARMRESRPDTVCVIVGDGPACAKLKRDHPDVRFAGFMIGEELATCFASSDILLFPSETETFGNVLIEGMASGIAILGYDYAAAAWHGMNGSNLLKVDKGDEGAFLDAAELLLDPAMREQLGLNARRTAENLSWPGVVIELENIFRELIAQS